MTGRSRARLVLIAAIGGLLVVKLVGPIGSGPRTEEGYWANAPVVWADEFDGAGLDPSRWRLRTGGGGWGNDELQDYSADNATVANGLLSIHAQQAVNAEGETTYSSARIASLHAFQYGRVEIRARVPTSQGPGLWPALWMMGKNQTTVGWPACGELDLMEYVSYQPGFFQQAVHTKISNHSRGPHVTSGPIPLPTIDCDFHRYGVLWDRESVRFYLDEISNITLTYSRPQVEDRPKMQNVGHWPFDQPFFLILNMAVGGSWGGRQGVDDSVFPATFEIDYVRVYQFNADE